MTEPVLILGAGGFIGRALTRGLAATGIPVIAVGDVRASESHPLVENIPGKPGTADDLAPLLARSGKVVHAATTSTPGTSAAMALREVETNLRFTALLLEALQLQPGKQLLYFSSGGSLYSGIDRPSGEDAPVCPRSYHGAAKLASESFIAAWCHQFGGHATILRPSNVYGPGQEEKAGFGVIPTAFGKLLRSETMHVWGDGTSRRDYVYIDDVVGLCRNIVTRAPAPGAGIFNVCSGESTSLNDLLHSIEEVTGKSLDRVYEQSRSVDAPIIAMDPGAAMEAYGWRPRTGIADGLARSWEWFQRHAGA